MQAGRRMPRGSTRTSPPRLVAREVERRAIVQLLKDDGVRLVSIVGAPGAGKTRLAMVTAGDLDQVFVDGIVFVDLSPVQEPALVPAAIAAVLGVWEAGDRDV